MDDWQLITQWVVKTPAVNEQLFELHGPFSSAQAAEDFADKVLGAFGFTVVELIDPKSYDE